MDNDIINKILIINQYASEVSYGTGRPDAQPLLHGYTSGPPTPDRTFIASCIYRDMR